ncbi:metallophosphoesterase [Candidatus Woesearchaeota archaeon]|nr:metallophosphoesterase [Candidatus Woesearchaeota archaeon]
MKQPLRILACSDIHGDKTLLEQLAVQADKEKADVVIIAGDFAPRDGVNTAPPYLVGRFLNKGKKVFLLNGNWESESLLKMIEDVYGLKSIHGDYATFGDVGIFGCGGASIGPFATTEQEIFEGLERGFNKIKNKPVKIMVTHAHPAGSTIEKFTNLFPGSIAVRKAIDEFQPDIVFCGHVHEAQGIEETIGKTKVINVAKTGKVIEV